jgi:Leucine-rich repeat (LRR) protein
MQKSRLKNLRPVKPFLKVSAVLLFLFSFKASAQQDDLPVYSRPSYKAYKSVAAALANPDSAYILDLSGKKLTQIPPGVYKLPNLLVLDLSRNKIKVLPDSIAMLSSLEELDLSSNKLSAVPAAIGSFKWLKKLSLNRNTLTNLPPEIGNLNALEVLELWDNELEDLPDEIRNLKNLKILELRGILFSEEQHLKFKEMVPGAKVFLSPSCNCKM